MINTKRAVLIVVGLLLFEVTSPVSSADFKINVFHPDVPNVQSNLQNSIASVASPDFAVNYVAVDSNTWANVTLLSNFLISSQRGSPADGFFLACKNSDLSAISENFRRAYPKVPFVDSYAPSLMAANLVSFRYAIITAEVGLVTTNQLVTNLGIEDHVRTSLGPQPDERMILGLNLNLSSPKAQVVEDIVSIGRRFTGAHWTDKGVYNIEALALAGCEGFLEVGVASEAQADLDRLKIPLQVINPIKASMGLLYSAIRNRVWVSE